jgi:predicted aspartyl protease
VVGRVYVPLSCFGYARGVVHEYPVLRVRLFNLAGEEFGTVELGVDTGFEGSILLDREAYEFFAVGELPREAWRRYRTFAGPLPMRTARAVAELGGRRVEVLVETPLYGGGKRLVGRELLNKLVLVLDGPRREACVAREGGEQG